MKTKDILWDINSTPIGLIPLLYKINLDKDKLFCFKQQVEFVRQNSFNENEIRHGYSNILQMVCFLISQFEVASNDIDILEELFVKKNKTLPIPTQKLGDTLDKMTCSIDFSNKNSKTKIKTYLNNALVAFESNSSEPISSELTGNDILINKTLNEFQRISKAKQSFNFIFDPTEWIFDIEKNIRLILEQHDNIFVCKDEKTALEIVHSVNLEGKVVQFKQFPFGTLVTPKPIHQLFCKALQNFSKFRHLFLILMALEKRGELKIGQVDTSNSYLWATQPFWTKSGSKFNAYPFKVQITFTPNNIKVQLDEASSSLIISHEYGKQVIPLEASPFLKLKKLILNFPKSVMLNSHYSTSTVASKEFSEIHKLTFASIPFKWIQPDMKGYYKLITRNKINFSLV